jgi:hypothetical protein
MSSGLYCSPYRHPITAEKRSIGGNKRHGEEGAVHTHAPIAIDDVHGAKAHKAAMVL